jgi:hypothetical protein
MLQCQIIVSPMYPQIIEAVIRQSVRTGNLATTPPKEACMEGINPDRGATRYSFSLQF